MFCVADFEGNAREVLDRNSWDYYSSGAIHEQTLRDNVEAYSRLLTLSMSYHCPSSVYM